MRIDDIKPIDEMAKQARICPNCNKPITGNHYWYKGEWRCKKGAGKGTSAQTPTADQAPAQAPGVTPKVVEPQPVAAPTPAARAAAPTAAPATAAQPTVSGSQQVEAWLERHQVKNFKIEADGTVDVDGNVRLLHYDGASVPVKFGKVTGDFICSIGELQSLQNFPTEVDGDCMVDHNILTSFEGLPQKVGGSMMASGNEGVESIDGLPREIGADLYLEHIPKLTSLHNIHKTVRSVGGKIYLHSTPIQSAILGVLLIRGLKEISGLQGTANQKAQEIINAALTGERDVHMTQDALIDAGFADLAEL